MALAALLVGVVLVPGAASAAPTPDNSTTSENGTVGVDDAPLGILDGDRNASRPTAQRINQQLADGLYVTGVDWRDGYALLDVVSVRPGGLTEIAVTDSNSIGRTAGSGEVRFETYRIPSGRFELKVSATVASGDQTITVGVEDDLYWFSDAGTPQSDGWWPGLKDRYGSVLLWLSVSGSAMAGVFVTAGAYSIIGSRVKRRQDL